MVNMTEEIEAGVEMKVETKTQKVVSKLNMRKTVRLKNGLHLMNKGSIQNIRLREDIDFASLYEDTKKKMRQNFTLVNFQ